MPVYTYRREDGTMFEMRQNFSDEPLMVDPSTGQKVVRVVHNAGVIFKGSGFYVNDSKSASKKSLNGKASETAAKTDDAPAKAESSEKARPATESAAD